LNRFLGLIPNYCDLGLQHEEKQEFISCAFDNCYINNTSFFLLNTLYGILHTIQDKQFFTEIKKSDNDTIHIILEREYFKYAIMEKSIFYNVDKNINFIENEKVPFIKGVLMSSIRDWY
jgi:hypothetical protein